MNITAYKSMIDKITETADQRAALEKFIATGGRFKLAVTCTEDPAIGAMMTDIFRQLGAFDVLMNRAVRHLQDIENHHRKLFLDQATQENLAAEIGENQP